MKRLQLAAALALGLFVSLHGQDYYRGTVTGGGVGTTGVTVGFGRAAAQTAAVASIATYTVPAGADGNFVVAAHVLVTTATTCSFQIEVAYTDEASAARVLTLSMNGSGSGGGASNFAPTVTCSSGAIDWSAYVAALRAKAGTTITLRTNAVGVYTTVTYTVDGWIQRVA